MPDLSVEEMMSLIALERLPIAAVILLGGWVGMALMRRVLDDLGERFADRRLFFKKVQALVRFFLYLALAIVIPLSVLRDTGREALMPLLAAVGIGLGLSLKGSAESLLAGVLLLIDEPFQVGDRISFGGYYGEVTEIRLRSVRLVTLDDNLVSIPTSQFLGSPVASANAGALDCMVVVPFYVGAAEDVDLARRILHEVAATSRYVYLDKPVVTVVADQFLGERFVTVISVKAYVFDARFEKAFSTDLTVRAKRAFREAGVRTPDQVYRDLDMLGGELGAREAAQT